MTTTAKGSARRGVGKFTPRLVFLFLLLIVIVVIVVISTAAAKTTHRGA